MLDRQFCALKDGEFQWHGYIEQLILYVQNEHFCKDEVWSIFVDQFRTKSDEGWRWKGEYWGKAMRGAAMIYRCTQNQTLYRSMEQTVRDLLTTQEENGRISSYLIHQEFCGWDIWARKYILLGCLYFYDICKDEGLKDVILTAMERHLDYLVDRIGDGEGKTSIFRTSDAWGALNSCSILEPVVKMYRLTKKECYLEFAKYIVSTGFSEDENYIDISLHKEKYPYQFATTKAYELMSCFQGLLEYSLLTEEKHLLSAVVNFAELLQESEITIIGCAGCQGEFFDHSAVTQTEFSEEEMQETCVTVTWMNLCYRLLEVTGEEKYADWLEKSALNAMNGSVNTERQLVLRGNVMDYRMLPMKRYQGKRRILPFDSYSPLVNSHRGKLIAGFNIMEGEEIYGCCACIGGLGLALEELFGLMRMENGFVVNLYGNATMESTYQGKPFRMTMESDWSGNPCTIVHVRAHGRCELALRIPSWTKQYKVLVNGKVQQDNVKDGYVLLEREWGNDTIELFFDTNVQQVELNGKIAFTKCGYVLTRTEESGEDVALPIGRVQHISAVEQSAIECDIALEVQTSHGNVFLCDYAHAGKQYDEEHCNLTVWSEQIMD